MKIDQLSFDFSVETYNRDDLQKNINTLIKMHKLGRLGGEIMPEDARPSSIEINSADNFHFLTFPMALNYQRNSYKLWESAADTYLDKETRDVFDPLIVKSMDIDLLRSKLTKHKLALQPNKHTNTWRTLCITVSELFENDVRNIFLNNNNDVIKIKNIIQTSEKKRFPYLSGPKILNYWLYVIEGYTNTSFINRNEITIAPDTHIIQGSLRLGIINGNIQELSQDRTLVSDAWKLALKDSDVAPIDVHTPLWLWSRKGFPQIEDFE
jgi:hypothetical protein